MTPTALTGTNGFIGSHLARALAAQGRPLRGLVREGSDLRSLEGIDIQLVKGNILEEASLVALMEGCEQVFHVAGTFTYWGHSADVLVATAQQGMQTVMDAAQKAGVKRVIVTSSSVTVGASRTRRALTEDKPGSFEEHMPYVRSKIAQEDLAFALGKKYRLEVVAVCPTLTVGGPDFGPTESNRMIVNYLSDPMKASWIGGCNIVAVADIVAAHLLVSAKGLPGQRYLAGADNHDWTDVHRMISALCGLEGPFVVANHTSALLAATFQELMSRLTNTAPASSREQARMVGNYYWYDHSKLAALGYVPQTTRTALAAAISWLAASEHLPASKRAELAFSAEIYAYRTLQQTDKQHRGI